jgi:hypothetical protein
MTRSARPLGPSYRRMVRRSPKDKPVPSIIDFTMVDTNKDAMIDADAFKAGCTAGWIVPAS